MVPAVVGSGALTRARVPAAVELALLTTYRLPTESKAMSPFTERPAMVPTWPMPVLVLVLNA